MVECEKCGEDIDNTVTYSDKENVLEVCNSCYNKLECERLGVCVECGGKPEDCDCIEF